MTAEVLQALAPVAIIIALGYGLRRLPLVADSFWPQAERVAYYVLLPALFVHSLATAKLQSVPVSTLAAVLAGSTLTVAALVVGARPLMRVDGAAFTSIFQGSIRFNNYVGVTAAAGLFGAQGIALAAVCNAVTVPLVNLLSILIFAQFGSTPLSLRGVLRQLASNPLLLSCAVGLGLQNLGTGLPAGLDPALKALGAAALPLGLLCVGAALTFGTAQSWLGPVVTASTAKFLALPIATLLVGRACGLDGPPLVVAMLFQALPTASSAYILSRQLGGDAPLMAGITAAQTLIATLTIPLVLAALSAISSQ